MNKKRWMMLGLNVAQENIVIMGFSDKEDQARIKAAARAAENGMLTWKVFLLSKDAPYGPRVIKEWLMKNGVTEPHAKYATSEVLKKVLALILEGPRRS